MSEKARDENYIFSPLSLKAAMALAIVGAEGDTREQMLSALGFASVEKLADWYAKARSTVDIFYSIKENMTDSEFVDGGEDMEYRILNAVWQNTDADGHFKQAYIDSIDNLFAAVAKEAPGSELADALNTWADENTNGLIKHLVDDLSDATAVLANALYLRSSWAHSFNDAATEEGDFTTVTGEVVRKDFMNRRDSYRYYEDGENKLIVIPLVGDIDFVAVLGDMDDVIDAYNSAENEKVILSIPKLDIESEYSRNEIIDFLEANGVELAFSDHADFSAMVEGDEWNISDIIQKARIKTDEDGLEAAAVTAIVMMTSAAMPQVEPEYKEFIADHPFQFFVLTSEEQPEILFAGACQK